MIVMKANLVPSSGFFMRSSRASSASRSGITRPTRPRRRCGVPVIRWNWLCPTLTHMLSTLVIR